MINERLRDIPYRLKIVLVILSISLILLVPEISFGGGSGFEGGDMFFHLTRYLDAAMQMKTGHFSYFQQFFTNNNSGRIMNALYGPLFAYFQGFLLLLSGFRGIIWYVLYCWLTNFVGIACMFYCLRTNFIRPKTALLLSVFYAVSGNVAIQVINGTYAIGYAFFPLIIAASLRLLRSNSRPVVVWELVLAFTVLAQTHMMSLLLGVCIYFLAFLYFSLKSFKKKNYFLTVKFLILSAVLFLLMNFNIWGGYIEVIKSNPNLVMPFTPSMLNLPYTLNFSSLGFSQFSAFTAMLVVISLLVIVKSFHLESLEVKFAFAMVVLFSFFAFGVVNVNKIPGITLFQFYTRFMVIALPLGLFLVGKLLSKENGKLFHIAAYFALVFTLIPYFSLTTQQASSFVSRNFSTFRNSMTAQDCFEAMTRPATLLKASFYKTRTMWGLADYVPGPSPKDAAMTNKENYDLFLDYFSNDVFKQAHFVGSGLQRTVTSNGLEITWNSDKPQETMLPVLDYAHTRVILNGKKLSNSEKSTSYIGALKVKPQTGKNTLLISYQPAKWFIYGIFVQILSLIGICIFVLVRKIKVRRSA